MSPLTLLAVLTLAPAQMASAAGILQEMNTPALPPTGKPLTAENLPKFQPRILARYVDAPVDRNLRLLLRQVQAFVWLTSGAEAPKELAADLAIASKDAGWKDFPRLPDFYPAPPLGPRQDAPLRERLAEEGKKLASALAAGEELLEKLNKLSEVRDRSPLRWQAHHDYLKARLLLQIANLYERSSALARMRREFPPLDRPRQHGWRLVPTPQMEGDPVGKKLFRQAGPLLEQITKNYPGTPWDILAQRERKSSVGLDWKAE